MTAARMDNSPIEIVQQAQRLRHTVTSDGGDLLVAFGFGSLTSAWWMLSQKKRVTWQRFAGSFLSSGMLSVGAWLWTLDGDLLWGKRLALCILAGFGGDIFIRILIHIGSTALKKIGSKFLNIQFPEDNE